MALLRGIDSDPQLQTTTALLPQPTDDTHSVSLSEYELARNGRLVSFSQPTHDIDPADFLHYGLGRERFYWHDERNDIALAGLGVAVDLMAWGETRVQGIERQARELFANALVMGDDEPLAAPRLFGGFAFRQDFVPDITWTGFNPAHFILPHYQLVRHGGQTWLTINTLMALEEDPLENQLPEALQAFEASLRSHLGMPARQLPGSGTPYRHEIAYPMSYQQWEEIILRAVEQSRTTSLNKVVLSRVCEIRLNTLVDVDAALAYLGREYADCYGFLFEPRPHHAFFGATPELLVAVEGHMLTTTSLAGSTRRGKTAEEDAMLAAALLHSAKDRHEHALVVASIERRLRPLVERLDVPAEPTVFKLSNIQHLYTPIHGMLRQKFGVLPLVEILHPTPALGGTPRDLALDFIRQAEPVPRGWYAAPVGWIDRHLDGAFGVAIRSAVAQNRRVWLYAGAGIVPDSQPQREWEETAWKFRPIQEALGITTLEPASGMEDRP